MDSHAAAKSYWWDDKIARMEPSELRFLQPREPAKILSPSGSSHIILRPEDLTIAQNMEAIRAAFYVIFRAVQLIFGIWGRMLRAFFASEATYTRRRRWVSACASAMVGAAINSAGVLIFLKLL